MRDLKTILVAGKPSYIGAVLVRKLLKAGHKVKASEAFIYRNDIFLGSYDLNSICNINFTEIVEDFCDTKKIKEIIPGCDVVIYLDPAFTGHDYEFDYDILKSLIDGAKASDVGRFIYVSGYSMHNALFVEHFKNMALDNFTFIVVDASPVRGNPLKQNLEIPVDILTKNATRKHKIILYGSKQTNAVSCEDLPDNWYSNHNSNISGFYIDGIADLCLCLLEWSLEQIQRKIWPHIATCKIFLNRFYISNIFFQMLRKPYVPGIVRIKFCFYIIKRLFDVSVMMFLVHLWPEQTYRFSTRKLLPDKARRYHRSSKPIIPYELIESRRSDIPKMKEVNIVLRGSSFDIKQLEKLDPPIFLVSFWDPVQTEKDVIYVMGRAKNALRLGKLGLKVIHVEVNTIDYNGNIALSDSTLDSLWYKRFMNDDICKHIAILEKIYRPPKPPFPLWTPTGSALPAICALSYFAEKLNVYGWDFYLESSPDDMTYRQLYFNLYKFKLDVLRSRNHLESAIINFYYGYHLSNLPNINIYGQLGQLSRHEKLIGKLERVLFNK